MAVLVTGVTGLLGSHVVELLLSRGETVRALVRPDDPSPAVGRLMAAGVDVCFGDLGDQESLQAAVSGVERVLHCAARTGPWGPRREYEIANVWGLETLLDLSLAAGVQRFVHVSSITVHGNDVGGEADESAPLRVEPNPYSWSKVLGERFLRQRIADQKAPVTIVRPGWIYGPGDAASFARFASRVQNRRMILMGSGNNHVPLIYVGDVAQGILLASETAQAEGKTYLLVNDERVTQREYFSAIARELGVPAPRWHIPYPLALALGGLAEWLGHMTGRQAPPPVTRYGVQLLGGENRFVIDRARRELGFSPEVGLAEGVKLSVAWYRTVADAANSGRG
jgi:nucleoside-diphosphate-sugar epimerase